MHTGSQVFRLIDDDGCVVRAFDHFTTALFRKELAYATIKRYLEVVASFLDYLVEAKVFGTPVSTACLNEAVGYYVQVRVKADRIRAEPDDSKDALVRWGKPIVNSLGLNSVAPNPNMVAAINMFLRLSETLARTEWERAAYLGLPLPSNEFQLVIREVDGFETLSLQERKALKQSSMLANVQRLNPSGIKRPRGLKGPKQTQTKDDLDFPLLRMRDLVAAARTIRDRLLWLLLAASGLRTSEVLALKWEHIDLQQQKVFVEDPNGFRHSKDLPLAEKMRFKGRAVSDTYLFQPLRDEFFDALADYLRTEYVAGAGHDYVFQDVRPGSDCGRPMHELSDTARNRNFRRATERAGIAHPTPGETWTLHSLRHAYGVYMLNYLPVPGGYGLALNEVSKLMGHSSEKTTSHYARSDKLVLAAKLEYADWYVSPTSTDWHSLPEIIAQRLRHEASRYEQGNFR